MSAAARKCLYCQEKFHPRDARNRRHQQYCPKDGCRKASEAARQARWLAKPQNRDYFRDSANCERVRLWRIAHPGYPRRLRYKTYRIHNPLKTCILRRLARHPRYKTSRCCKPLFLRDLSQY